MKREPAFLATVYHDEPEDAATDSSAEFFTSHDDAVEWARRAMTDPYWNGFPSTVHSGFIVEERGHAIRQWEGEDDAALWLVYANSIEREQ